MNDDRSYCLAWMSISGVGPILIKRLITHFGSLKLAWLASNQELIKVAGFGNQLTDKISQSRQKINPNTLLKEHLKTNPYFWTFGDRDYPRLLEEIPTSPSILYYSGQVNLLENYGNHPLVAIVGTRYPTEYGKKWTKIITTNLVKAGFTIVSGMAQGIDTEAHRAAIIAGGRTIAVVGTGLDIIYPAQNQELAKIIYQHGLILSEYPQGTKPDKAHFPQRNRIIAGLCRAVIVIEAPLKSGALITANMANDFNRDVYILPGSLDQENSLGCLNLINQGAQVILGIDSLLQSLGELPNLSSNHPPQQLNLLTNNIPNSTTSPSFNKIDLPPILDRVFQEIITDPISLDHLISQTNLDISTVSSSLLELELMGLISQLPGMQYKRN